MAIVGVAAKRYAAALLDVAQEKSAVDRCLKDLQTFSDGMSGSTELNEVLVSPAVPSDQATGVVASVAEKMGLDRLSVAFLALLSSRRRMEELPEVITAYSAEQESRSGRQKGDLVSAGMLAPGHVVKIREAIGKVLGCQLTLTQKTDPDLLGGLRVSVGDRVFDLATRSYLESLRTKLLENR